MYFGVWVEMPQYRNGQRVLYKPVGGMHQDMASYLAQLLSSQTIVSESRSSENVGTVRTVLTEPGSQANREVMASEHQPKYEVRSLGFIMYAGTNNNRLRTRTLAKWLQCMRKTCWDLHEILVIFMSPNVERIGLLMGPAQVVLILSFIFASVEYQSFFATQNPKADKLCPL